MSPIAGELLAGLSYLGEETTHDEYLREHLSDDVLKRKHAPQRFFESHENVLRVIFDGIDGTGNFNRGLPLFCSAAAILVDDQVRVSAIYDPIHHQVSSAVLPGPYENPERDATASAWDVATGNRVDVVADAKKQVINPLNKEAVAIHLTRSNPDKLKEFVGTQEGQEDTMLERLAGACGGIYAINSGIMAMKEITRGAFGGFVNIVTYPWDVAAGEVLVRACGGIVTGFDGNPVKYEKPGKISVIAAKGHLHEGLKDVLKPKN